MDYFRFTTSLLLGVIVALSSGQAVRAQPEGEDEEAIRQIRELSNEAILNRDIEALAGTWVEDMHVAGSSGDSLKSGEDMKRAFAGVFKEADFVRFNRIPRSIQLSPGGNLAAEAGDWLGEWNKSDGKMTIHGTYMAQWTKSGGDWKIKAEVFVATACEGSSSCAGLP